MIRWRPIRRLGLEGGRFQYRRLNRQLPPDHFAPHQRNQFAFHQRSPALVRQWHVRKKRHFLTGPTHREPVHHNAAPALFALPLQQHEARSFDFAGLGVLAAVSVREERVAVRIEKIRRPQSPDFAREGRHDRKSRAQRRHALACDQIDAIRSSRTQNALTARYRQDVLETQGNDLDTEARALLEEDLRSPRTEEIAVFQAFSRVIRESSRHFVLMDTAPTGHTLLLLDATGSYHRDIIRHASADTQGRIVTPMMRLQDPEPNESVRRDTAGDDAGARSGAASE